MPRIELAPELLEDFDRFLDHLSTYGAGSTLERLGEIAAAIQILAHSPLIGRKAEAGKRELVIGRGSRGYVALYRYIPTIDTVFVLAIRRQREAGYPGENRERDSLNL
ncbi:MAG: type II toxin-antitoxin system RelE/ParE family toxin [Betaproteobacteria bacterium]